MPKQRTPEQIDEMFDDADSRPPIDKPNGVAPDLPDYLRQDAEDAE